MNIIGYIRVSTDEQAERGFSLNYQEEAIKRHCQQKGYNLIGIYKEDFSAFGNFSDRPEWSKIETFVKNNKGLVSGILCLRWDRFARNLQEALSTIGRFKKKNIEILTIENPIDLNVPENKLMLSIFLTQAEIESDKNSIRTKQGLLSGKLQGYWMGKAPYGYNNVKDENGKSTLGVNIDESKVVIDIFEKMSRGVFSAEEMRKEFSKKAFNISKQGFLNLLRNVAYIGKIFVAKTGNEPEKIVEAKHEGLISESIFQRVQDILSGKKPKMKFHDDKSDLYPLKPFLFCEKHKRSLTAAGNKSRNGSIHHYYHCSVAGCKERIKIEQMEDNVLSMLKKLQIPNEICILYKSILEDKFSSKNKDKFDDIKSLEGEITTLNLKKSNLEDKFLSNEISSEIFNSLNEKLNQKMKETENKIQELKEGQFPFRTYINQGINILPSVADYFTNSDGITKQRILGSMFSGKLVIEENKVRTAPWREVVSDFILINKELEGLEIKKVSKKADLSSLAPPAGLEPATL